MKSIIKILDYDFKFVIELKPINNVFFDFIKENQDKQLNEYGKKTFCNLPQLDKKYNISGIYCLFDEKNRILYCGRTTSLCRRFNNNYKISK